jgi:hypothetical protein
MYGENNGKVERNNKMRPCKIIDRPSKNNIIDI